MCDEAGIVARAAALAALHEGVRKGLITRATRGDFPQNIWSVTKNGLPLEAELENRETGTYHGYPMPENDPFREAVLDTWKARR